MPCPFLFTNNAALIRSFPSLCSAERSTDSNLEKKHVDVLTLQHHLNPVKAAYWTNLPHHRRTPFAVSPDGDSAYLAYLDSSETDVHVQQLDPSSSKATGTFVTVTGGKEGTFLCLFHGRRS